MYTNGSFFFNKLCIFITNLRITWPIRTQLTGGTRPFLVADEVGQTPAIHGIAYDSFFIRAMAREGAVHTKQVFTTRCRKNGQTSDTHHYSDVIMAMASNHWPHGCLLNRLFRRRSKKTSKLRVTGLCVGNSPGTGEFPTQMASNAKNVSIWWRHHVYSIHEELLRTILTYFSGTHHWMLAQRQMRTAGTETCSTHWRRDNMAAIMQTTFSNWFSLMKMFRLKFSLKFVPKIRIKNITVLVQIKIWRRPGDKSLSGPMTFSLLTYTCVTRPQWVKMFFG